MRHRRLRREQHDERRLCAAHFRRRWLRARQNGIPACSAHPRPHPGPADRAQSHPGDHDG